MELREHQNEIALSIDGDRTVIVVMVFLILPLCLSMAAITDLLTMTIPNRIPFALIGAFLVLGPLNGMQWPEFGLNLAAGLLVFVGCFGLFALNVMGGGDAKLLTASAIWFGFNISLIAFMVSVAFMGGIVTLAIIILRSRSQQIMATGLPIPDSLLVAKKIPYGIAIAIAGLLTYPEAPIVQAAMRSIL